MWVKVQIAFSGHQVGEVIDVPEMDFQSLSDQGYVVALEKPEQKEIGKKRQSHVSKKKF